MLKAAVYCRVSTADQADQGYSLPSQLEACRRYATANGLEIVTELSEDCSGATVITARHVGGRLGPMVTRGEIGAVIVHQVDRLSRDIVDLLMTVRDWLQAGVEVHAGDVGRIESELDIVLILKGWQGGEERAKIRERTMRGKLAKAGAGFVVGGREPYGYRHRRDANGKVVNFDVVETEAEVVRLVFALYLSGDGAGEPMAAQAIARRLSEMRIATPGEAREGYRRTRAPGMWSGGSVIAILGHELYCGVWRYGARVRTGRTRIKRPKEEQISVDVPAIVDRATWTAAQERMRRNRRMSKRNRRRDYLLSGLIQCGCGSSMCGRASPSERLYYRCSASSTKNRHPDLEERPCHARSVRADAVEVDVWDSLAGVFEDPDRLEALLKMAQQEELEGTDPKRSELETVEGMIDEAEKQARAIGRVMVKASGVVGREMELEADAVNQRHEALVRRRDELRVGLDATRITDKAIEDTLAFANDVRLGFRDADYATRRHVLEMLQVTVTVDAGRFSVKSAIGTWSGDVRELPRGSSRNGGIVTVSPTLCSYNYRIADLVRLVESGTCAIEQLT